MKKKIKRYYADMNSNKEGVFKSDVVDKPAIQQKAFHFNTDKKPLQLVAVQERRIITGPALIPDFPIYRCDLDEKGTITDEYEIVFTADVIEKAMMKFMRDTQKDMVGVMHESNQPEKDIFIFECFMSDVQRGISAPKGFEHLPDRTWYMSAKINNDEVWERIKSGELTGWSIEGFFSYSENKPQLSLELIDSLSKVLLG